MVSFCRGRARSFPTAPRGGRRADLRHYRFVEIFHYHRRIIFRSVFQHSVEYSGDSGRNSDQRLQFLKRIILPGCVVSRYSRLSIVSVRWFIPFSCRCTEDDLCYPAIPAFRQNADTTPRIHQNPFPGLKNHRGLQLVPGCHLLLQS